MQMRRLWAPGTPTERRRHEGRSCAADPAVARHTGRWTARLVSRRRSELYPVRSTRAPAWWPVRGSLVAVPGARRWSPVGATIHRRPPEEHRVSEDRVDRGESIDLDARRRAYESVRAVLSDDHNYEAGVAAARSVAAAVLTEAGAEALVDLAVDLSLNLASALERIAADQGVAAVDLADVWFVE